MCGNCTVLLQPSSLIFYVLFEHCLSATYYSHVYLCMVLCSCYEKRTFYEIYFFCSSRVRPFQVTKLISQPLNTFLFHVTSSVALELIMFSLLFRICHISNLSSTYDFNWSGSPPPPTSRWQSMRRVQTLSLGSEAYFPDT
jgi:hypothetical protein